MVWQGKPRLSSSEEASVGVPIFDRGSLGALQGRKKAAAAAKIPEKSHFHGKQERDPVTGRTWLDPPKGKKKENEYCYLPKKWVHTWSGHTKGVNAIRFFPGTGEMLCFLHFCI